MNGVTLTPDLNVLGSPKYIPRNDNSSACSSNIKFKGFLFWPGAMAKYFSSDHNKVFC